MPSLKITTASLMLPLFLFACAPRAVVKVAPSPAAIPAETPPGEVLNAIRSAEERISGLRASVKITVRAEGKAPQGFDGVLYAQKPDSVRLTGLALLGVTVFDVVVTADKFYFYQPAEGYLYAGPKSALRGFLEEKGVDVDPDVILKTFFTGGEGGTERYFVEKAPDGYNLYLLSAGDQTLKPLVKAEYGPGLELRGKTFFDEESRPYLYVSIGSMTEEGGHLLPNTLTAKDVKAGYTVEVAFEKYIINPPEGMESDFTIEGGELKGIREVE